MTKTYTYDEIAEAVHEVNRAFCRALGDNSQPPWCCAPDWQKSSIKAGLEALDNNPDMPPSASHDNWLQEKADTGWSYGPVKDPEKKEHPCFVSYEKLPPEQRAKDYLFRAVVLGMLGKLK